MTSMETWAEKEVELACKRENPDWDGKSFDYGCLIYQSALKAYKSLCEDGHSGASFGFTRGILERLMRNLPLTPITEDDFKEADCCSERNNCKEKQCPRMLSLFRHEHKNGTVTYSDINRVICVEMGSDDDNGERHSQFGLITRFIDKQFPISLPYRPTERPYKAYVNMFDSTGKGRGGFDTVYLSHIITPDDKRIDFNRVWKVDEDGTFVEISVMEYMESVKKARSTRNEQM